jgi:tRNA/tmRNA/rRNA uracil-C5-methylase (TrmA/RlmC/RlmD family)
VVQRVLVKIEKIVHGGHAIAFPIEVPVGERPKPLFVRYGLPGETGSAEITSETMKITRADLVDITNASADRVEPACKYANPNNCGGCTFQYLNPKKFDQLKQDIFLDQISRIGKFDPAKLNISSFPIEKQTHWRKRMTFAITPAGNSVMIGLHSARSNQVVPIDQCLIAESAINDKLNDPDLLKKINQKYRASDAFARGELGKLKIAVGESSVGNKISVMVENEVIDGAKLIYEEVNDFIYEVSPQSFWQGHTDAGKILVSQALSKLNFEVGDTLLDLYGGAGLFGIAFLNHSWNIGKPFREVISVENDGFSGEDAKKNYARATADKEIKSKVHLGSVEKILPKIKSCDRIILDPPRAGASATVIKEILRLNPKEILYISCDPASFARDAALLAGESGPYHLAEITTYDLYPATPHLETVSLFTRK